MRAGKQQQRESGGSPTEVNSAVHSSLSFVLAAVIATWPTNSVENAYFNDQPLNAAPGSLSCGWS